MVFDETAETLQDLRAQWPRSPSSLRDFIAAKVKDGEWEKVYKHVGGVVVVAYRRHR